MNNVEWKHAYLQKQRLINKEKYCEIEDQCQQIKGQFGRLTLHHMMHNTKGNRKKYPNLIDSVWNLQSLPQCCHVGCARSTLKKMSDFMADDLEKQLKDNPELSKRLNGGK